MSKEFLFHEMIKYFLEAGKAATRKATTNWKNIVSWSRNSNERWDFVVFVSQFAPEDSRNDDCFSLDLWTRNATWSIRDEFEIFGKKNGERIDSKKDVAWRGSWCCERERGVREALSFEHFVF